MCFSQASFYEIHLCGKYRYLYFACIFGSVLTKLALMDLLFNFCWYVCFPVFLSRHLMGQPTCLWSIKYNDDLTYEDNFKNGVILSDNLHIVRIHMVLDILSCTEA